MRILGVAAAVLAVILASPLVAGQEEEGAPPARRVPEGAVVRLEADRTEWLLGEECVVRFVVENRGKSAFKVAIGGDVRNTTRAVRFEVVAERAGGGRAKDPDPIQDCMGGPCWNEEIAPGGRWTSMLRLHPYVLIEQPGEWTVRVTHDLGWGDGAPSADIRLRFRAPLPAEADRVVDSLVLAAEKGEHWDAAYINGIDGLGAIRQAAYLPALVRAAGRGLAGVVHAVGRIATKEATRALADLLESPTPNIRRQAGLELRNRVPDPENRSRLAIEKWWDIDMSPETRQALAESWDPAVAPSVRAGGLALARSADTDAVEVGAWLLACVAVPEDVDALGEIFVRESARDAGDDQKENAFLQPSWTLKGLAVALRRAVALRTLPAGPPKSLGEAVVFLEALEEEGSPRPEKWTETLQSLAGHALPYVRCKAVQAIPLPLAAPFREVLRKALVDEDAIVAVAACEKAGWSRDPSLLPEVLESMRRAKHPRHLDSGAQAAKALGDYCGRVRIAVGFLDREELAWKALGILVDAFEPVNEGHSMGGDFGDVAELKPRWLEFLEAHGKEMEAGTRFKAGDGIVTRDLFPKDFKYSLGGNRMGWPGEEDGGKR